MCFHRILMSLSELMRTFALIMKVGALSVDCIIPYSKIYEVFRIKAVSIEGNLRERYEVLCV